MTTIVLIIAALLLAVATPATAIPTCPAGSMADYIGFGATGCQVNRLTFSNFAYQVTPVSQGYNSGTVLDPPASGIAVTPRAQTSGASLHFRPMPLVPGLMWIDLRFSFDVTGPVYGNVLSGQLLPFANMSSAAVGETITHAPDVTYVLGLYSYHVCGTPEFGSCHETLDRRMFPATAFQHIDIGGYSVNEVEAGFVTPEPATGFLLGNMLLAVVVWRRHKTRLERQGYKRVPN
jgi:hypothetical protein